MDWSGADILLNPRILLRLLQGLWVTISLSLIAVGASLILGTLLGLAMTSRNTVVRAVTRIYLEIIRIVPQLVLLFLVYFGLTRVSQLNLTGYQAALLVFTAWGTAEMGDLVRGALQAVPEHQVRTSFALGLSPSQRFRHVIGPQAVRALIPPTVNLVTRMIKTTSIVVLIGVVEVVKVGQQIIDANRFEHPDAALWIYALIFALYFVICYPISIMSRRLEKRWTTTTRR